jgi:TetR/AcrR family transcriptional repressor of bet genes
MRQDDMTAAEPPMTRRAQAKAERRLALIDATVTSIADHGLSGTTLARVAAIAGTSLGLANFHFETKERLFEAVLQHLADEERALWRDGCADPALTHAQRLAAFAHARFHPVGCDRRKLAVWFAFWGDASARAIYRRVVEDLDEERLSAMAAVIASLESGEGGAGRDPVQVALGLEAFYDGLWLNHLLYEDDYGRASCLQRAAGHLAALYPAHFPALQTAAPRGSASEGT